MHEIIFKNPQLESHLRPILSKWVDIINDYTNNVDNEDALFWYNERATLSTLSAAAWMNGCRALEEYTRFKFSDKKDEPPVHIDLWILCDATTQYVIEAKQIFVSISEKGALDEIEAALQQAHIAAVTSKYPGQTGLDVIFVVPDMPLSKKNVAKKRIGGFIQDLQQLDYDILAYTFPEKAKLVWQEHAKFYPGVVLLGKVPRDVKRQT